MYRGIIAGLLKGTKDPSIGHFLKITQKNQRSFVKYQ